MRVLFASYPEKTILFSLTPLAWALRTAGHEVCFASQPGFADVITSAGLTAVPVGRNSDPWRMAALDPDQVEAERAGIPRPYDAAVTPEHANWEYLTAEYAQAVKWWHKLENVPMVPDLVAFARYWHPDLVIWEPTTFAGAIAANACRAAHGRLLYSLDMYGVTREIFLRLNRERPPAARADPLGDWLRPYATKYGFEFSEELVTGQFTIDPIPRPLGIAADLRYLPMRYVPYGGAAVVPKWLWEAPRRPRVALTLGLCATERYNGYTLDVQDILDSLADLDLEVVATIATTEQHKLTRVPDNARVVSYVPLHALIPTCAAVIHHAGIGSLATTSLYARPQLALPYHFDQPALAKNLAAQGFGITIEGAPTGAAVRESVSRLLSEPALREGAVRLREEMLATPTPNQLVPQLERLAAENRSHHR